VQHMEAQSISASRAVGGRPASGISRIAQVVTRAPRTSYPSRRAPREALVRWARRGFDIVFALGVLTVTAPVTGLAIIAIRMESPGPAIFRQRRMGMHGSTFELLKLRGMYIDAEQRHPELYDYGVTRGGDESFYFHGRDDPRVTRVGRVLRRYSIDELPNFWNVLRGEMSVVGPRPEIPELAGLYGDSLPLLLSVRPGVTSTAKAWGRDALSFDETLARELDYIQTRSIACDLRTIARTASTVIRGTDVY
jgi:lipopolysaccharide/colanic/teichoic acid biosynthesis glycosyltransferase